MIKSEKILLLSVCLFSVLFIIFGLEFDYQGEVAFGPGFIPVNAAIILLALCIYKLIKKNKKATSDPKSINPDNHNFSGLYLTIVILFLGVFSMEWIGLLIPLFFMMILLSKFVLRHNIVKSFMVSSITLLVIYIIFSVWLNLPIV